MSWTERYVRADAAGSGDGTTTANSGANGAFTLAEAITNSASNTGMRYNVMAVGGTFANTTTTRTFNGVATTTAPNWWRGCNTAAGDLDADFTTAKPSITFTTGQFSVTGAHQIFSNLSITAARNGPTFINSSATGPCQMDRCRVTNTTANSAAFAATFNGAITVSRSYFSATATATSVTSQAIANQIFEGNVFTGGGVGLTITVGSIVIKGNTFRATGSHGITMGSTLMTFIEGNTFRGCGGDGINITTIPTTCLIANNLFAAGLGWGINNASGGNTNVLKRLGNDFWSNSLGTETGFGDSPSLSQLSESNDPHTSSTNLALITGSSAKAGGQPGLFENESYTSYLDVGAVQRQEPGGGASVLRSSIIQGLGQI